LTGAQNTNDLEIKNIDMKRNLQKYIRNTLNCLIIFFIIYILDICMA